MECVPTHALSSLRYEYRGGLHPLLIFFGSSPYSILADSVRLSSSTDLLFIMRWVLANFISNIRMRMLSWDWSRKWIEARFLPRNFSCFYYSFLLDCILFRSGVHLNEMNRGIYVCISIFFFLDIFFYLFKDREWIEKKHRVKIIFCFFSWFLMNKNCFLLILF